MIASENFNPRSREGSDRESIGWEALNTISIHAPARGATPSRFHEEYSPYISIHAPARGATHVHVPVLSAYEISIHAPARGATMASVKSPHTAVPISIHAPARGATEDVLGSVYMEGISIHAPARGATSILSKIHPMFLTISHNASSFSSFPFHSFLPHLLNSSTFCALFQVRISRAFSVYYRFAPKKSTPDL